MQYAATGSALPHRRVFSTSGRFWADKRGAAHRFGRPPTARGVPRRPPMRPATSVSWVRQALQDLPHRSQANGLGKLVANGKAARLAQAPRRFQHAPVKPADDDNARLALVFGQPPQKFNTIRAGHSQIQDDGIRIPFQKGRFEVVGPIRDANLERVVLFGDGPDEIRHHRLVVDKKQPFHSPPLLPPHRPVWVRRRPTSHARVCCWPARMHYPLDRPTQRQPAPPDPLYATERREWLNKG